MAETQSPVTGPDLMLGVALADLADGRMLLGHVGEEQVLLVRRDPDVYAVGAHCTHYHGPLAEGIVVDHTVRCPWHHACFDLRTGEAVRTPAFSPLACWSVEQRDGKAFVREKRKAPAARPARKLTSSPPDKIVIIGGGAAGFAAAEMLRREGFGGSIIMLSDDDAPPVDRPNLSKDYLAGDAPEDWVPLRPDSFYTENRIDLRLQTHVTDIDPRGRQVVLADGSNIAFDRLLLATGAEPVRLPIPGADSPDVFTLRSLADSRAIIARAKTARSVTVIGASFIGLEVAASLRKRGLQVHVIAPETRPMERILGPQMGDLVRALHEEHGVIFHLGETAAAINGKTVKLKSGSAVEGDFVVAGVGVRPRIALAESAGMKLDRGVLVDTYLETSEPGLFAAGDIARWPDPHSGDNIRVEHWVVAQRHGQIAARNMLGYRERFADVPFFWSQHYDVPINYAGHAEKWDALAIEGDVMNKDCILRYTREGRVLAVASIFRDVENLQAEAKMENSL